MPPDSPRPVTIEGEPLNCPICRYDQFWTRKTLMNTRGASLFSADWLNKAATNEVCDRCGYVLWFLDP